jgi:hypothetical protein
MIQIQFIISIHLPIFYYIRDRAKYKRCSLPNEIEYVFKIVLFISFRKLLHSGKHTYYSKKMQIWKNNEYRNGEPDTRLH